MSQPSTQLFKQLNTALLSAFDYDSLARFAQHELEIPLEHVSPVQGNRDLRTVIDHLVRYCAAEKGGLGRLITAAQVDRENHPELNALAHAWGETEFEVLSLPPDHPKLIAGARGVAIEGNVSGGLIITGDGNTVTQAGGTRDVSPQKKPKVIGDTAGEADNRKNATRETMSNRWILLTAAAGLIAFLLWASQFLNG